jgi:hypothetical protein
MANLFDRANYPETEPTELYVGDRWMWKRTDLASDYPTASYALSYVFRHLHTGSTHIDITATEVGDEYIVEVPSATTDGYTHSDYRWYAFITRSSDSQRIEIGSGTVTIYPNRVTDDDDPRTHAEQMVYKIELVLNNRADADVLSYSIAGRSLSKMSPDELVKWRDYYLAERAKERRSEAIKLGKGVNSKILVRFTQ